MTRFPSASLRSLAVAVAVFACAPPASADADSRLKVFGYTRALPVESVPDSIIDDWKYLDDRNVLVFRNSQGYLLVLSGACPSLQSAGVIGFNAATSGLVAAKTLVVGSRSTQTECGVEQIVKLDRVPFAPGAAAPPPRRAPAAASAPVPTPAPPPPVVVVPSTPPPAPAAPPPAPAPGAAPEFAPPPAAAEPAPSAPPPPPPPPPAIDRPIATPPGATPL